MADFVFTVAKGREAHYADLGAASDALVWVVLEAAGLEDDATLAAYTNLGAILAANTEQTTMGRKTATGVTVTTSGDDNVIDADDAVWTAASGNATGKLLLCYDADTGAGTDADIVPVLAWDFATTPAGVDIPAEVDAAGLITLS